MDWEGEGGGASPYSHQTETRGNRIGGNLETVF